MPAKVTIPNTFASATTAIPLSQLDANFSNVNAAINNVATFSNYAVDTGTANNYLIAITGQTTTYVAGVAFQFKATNTNTGASTLNVNSQGAISIVRTDGSALTAGDIIANGVSTVIYDGTNFQLLNDANTFSTPVTVAQGGTGLTTISAEAVLIGNTTGNIKTVSPGTTGNVLSSNGTTWISQAPAAATGNVTIGNTTIALGGTATTLGNVTMTNANIASGNVTVTTVSDQYGNVRAIGDVGSKTSAYTLVKADTGRYVTIGSGGSINITDNVFASGDVVSVFNNTNANANIVCTITTAYLAGTDADKASVNVATRGVATILFLSNTSCVIAGNVS